MEEPYHPSIVVYDDDGVTYHASAMAGSACNGSIPVYAGTKRINNEDDGDVAVIFAGDKKEAATRLRMECFRNDLLSAEHPHVVGVTKHFTYDGFFCVVLPRFDTTLRALFHQASITRRDPTNNHELYIVLALRDVLRGLSFIHGEGHVHGQIDADHVYLNYRSYDNQRRRRPKEIKLGYAASICDYYFTTIINNNTERRSSGGSIYLPTELLTRKSDMWSVGIMALELAYDIDVRFFKERSVLDALFKMINESKRLPSEEQMNEYMMKKKKMSSSSLLLRRSNIIGHQSSTNKCLLFSKHFSGMIAECLDPDPFKRPSADGLLNARPFKRLSNDSNYCLLGDINGNFWTGGVGPVIEQEFVS